MVDLLLEYRFRLVSDIWATQQSLDASGGGNSHHQMKKLISLLVALALLSLFTTCSFTRGKIKLEAQIVYNMGGPQPVAQQSFYLLKSDLKELLRQSVTQNLDKSKSSSDREVNFLAVTLVLLYLTGAGQAVKDSSANIKPVIDAFNTSKPAWESAIVQSAKTDFKGVATFENVPAGEYWITGITETRGGFALWNHKISVTRGENEVVLSQNNAVFSK